MNNLTIKSIASSSAGNCYIIDNGKTQIMIECGIPIKKIRQALDFNLSTVSGCLVSHHHQDHCKAVREVMKAGVDVFTSQGTIDALDLTGHRVKLIEAKKQFEIGTWTIVPFETIHYNNPDERCEGSLGFLLVSGKEKIMFCTDSAYIPHKFNGLTRIMIESNYCPDILERNIESGAVSVAQKNRLLFSHMSLPTVMAFLEDNDLSKLQQIFLMHLSAGNSNSAEMKRAVMAATGVPVTACKE